MIRRIPLPAVSPTYVVALRVGLGLGWMLQDHLLDLCKVNLTRPRDRNSPLFDNFKRRVLTALDRSLDRNVPSADPKTTAGEAMWW